MVIDDATGAVIHTIDVPNSGQVGPMAVDPVAARLYLSTSPLSLGPGDPPTGTNAVYVIDEATDNPVPGGYGTIALPSPDDVVNDLAADTRTHRVFVSVGGFPGGDVLTVLQLDGYTITDLTPTHDVGGIDSLAVDPILGRVYVVTGSSILDLDGRTGRVVHNFHTGTDRAAGSIAVDPSTDAVWAAGLQCSLLDSEDHFLVLDGTTFHASLTLSGRSEGSVTVDPSTDVAYLEADGFIEAFRAPPQLRRR